MDTAGRLKTMIVKNERKAAKAYQDRGPSKCMPMPPTTFALMAARFNNEERRLQAARSIKHVSNDWPQGPEQGLVRSLSKDSFHTMLQASKPHQLSTRDTPWR